MSFGRAGGLVAAAVLAMVAHCAGAGMAQAQPATGRPIPIQLVVPVAVFGSDDRVVLPQRLAQLEASIGLLYERRSRQVCTAFCVADRIVATAGHCIYRTSDDRAPPLNGFVFTLRQRKPYTVTTIAGAATGGGQQNVLAGAMRINTRPPIDASRDWALIKLSKPVCAGKALPLTRRLPEELTKLSGSSRVYQVGFHRDFANWKLALGPVCDIQRSFDRASWANIARDFTDANHLVLHTCDTGGASSGSPLLIDGAKGPEVAGINVGTYVQSRVLMQEGQVVKRYKADTVANTGVSSSAFAGRLDVFERADILARKDDIRRLQELLAARGLYAGKSDGTYGPQLRAAIERFEREENRAITGLATVPLLQRLSVVAAGTPATIELRGESVTTRGQKSRGRR